MAILPANDDDRTSKLPAGWRAATVGELAERIQYGTSAKTNEDATGVPVLRMGNIDGGRLRLVDLKYLPLDHAEFPELLLEEGDVLFNRTNSPELVGKTAVYEGLPSPASFASYLLRVRLKDFEPRLFSHYLNSTYGRTWIASVVSQQVGQANVNGAKLRALTVPVPPQNEQRRIVAKLDDVLARSRRAKQALDAVPPLLEKLRQSILAAAFRGDLTADWRATHPDVEPADALLARIRVERRKKWEEAELAKMKAKGKTPSDDRWKARYKEPEAVDASGLPELPEGWAWASPEELSASVPNALTIGPFGSDLKVSDYRDEGVPLVFVRDIRAESFGGQKTKFVSPEKARSLSRHLVQPGDLLITKMGDPPGDTAVYPADRAPGIITADCIKLASFGTLTDGEFLKYCFRAEAVRDQLLEQTAGVAQQKLSLERFRTVLVPLPPRHEQRELVARLDALFAHRDDVLNALETLACRFDILNKACLAKAFRGELVRRDPNDDRVAGGPPGKENAGVAVSTSLRVDAKTVTR